MLTLRYDGAQDRSDLVVLNANDFESNPVAVVQLPRRMPRFPFSLSALMLLMLAVACFFGGSPIRQSFFAIPFRSVSATR